MNTRIKNAFSSLSILLGMSSLFSLPVFTEIALAQAGCSVFVSHDGVGGGVQSHAGTVCDKPYSKVVTTVRLKSCRGNCQFNVTPAEGPMEGVRMLYIGGGTVKTLARNQMTCLNNRSYDRTNGGYNCQAFTSVKSSSANLCWSEMTGTIYDGSKVVDRRSWTSNIGNCR